MKRACAGALLVFLFCANILAEDSAGSLSLAEAVATGLRNNERVGIAAAQRIRARADARNTASELLPHVELGADYTRLDHERLGGRDAQFADARIDVPLVDAGALATARAANVASDAVDAQADEQRRQLGFDIADAFVLASSNERLQASAQRRLEVASDALSIAKQRLAAQLISGTDVQRLQLEEATARLTVTVAQQQALASRLQLDHLIGNVLRERELTEPEAIAALPSPQADLTPLIAEARSQRPDLRAALQSATATRLAAQEPKWDWVPRVSAFGTGATGNDPGLGRTDDNTIWSLGLSARWTLYDGGSRSARSDSLNAQARVAALTAAEAVRLLTSSLRTALSDVALSTTAVEQAEVQARVAEDLRVGVAQRFNQGLATALEQTDAAAAAFTAAADFTRAKIALRGAELRLARTLGHWPPGAKP